jgi:hypothetical protein
VGACAADRGPSAPSGAVAATMPLPPTTLPAVPGYPALRFMPVSEAAATFAPQPGAERDIEAVFRAVATAVIHANASPLAPPNLQQPVVSGNNVTLSWSTNSGKWDSPSLPSASDTGARS